MYGKLPRHRFVAFPGDMVEKWKLEVSSVTAFAPRLLFPSAVCSHCVPSLLPLSNTLTLPRYLPTRLPTYYVVPTLSGSRSGSTTPSAVPSKLQRPTFWFSSLSEHNPWFCSNPPSPGRATPLHRGRRGGCRPVPPAIDVPTMRKDIAILAHAARRFR